VRVEATTDGDATTIVSLTDRKGAPLDDLLTLDQVGDSLRATVRVVRAGRWRKNRSVDARLVVTAPLDVRLAVQANAGSVKVAGRTAPVSVEANAGSIELTRVEGNVEVSADAGAIKLVDGIGSARVTSDAGSISVQRQQGERLELRADAGRVVGRGLEVGHLAAHTDVGSVEIAHATPPVSVEASCSVGTVTIELPHADYDIEQQVGGLGRARLEGLAHVPGAERTVRVRSNGVGSITVRAAAGTPVHA
jgi:DUF4097 and DUF4098 domain-containing protein YvlB